MPFANNKESIPLEAALKQAEAKVRNLLAEYNAVVNNYRVRAEAVLETKERLSEKRRRKHPPTHADIRPMELELKAREISQDYAISLLTSKKKEYEAAVNAKMELETQSSLPMPVRRETRKEITEEDGAKINARVQAMRRQAEEEVRRRTKANIAPKVVAPNVPPHRHQEAGHNGAKQKATPSIQPHRRQDTKVSSPDHHSETDTYRAWREDVESAFKDYSRITTFPSPPFPEQLCTKDGCIANRPYRALKICPCDIERAIIAAARPLKEERMFWHPDRFSQCEDSVREEFRAKAKEIFQVVMTMYEAEKGSKR